MSIGFSFVSVCYCHRSYFLDMQQAVMSVEEEDNRSLHRNASRRFAEPQRLSASGELGR